MYTAKKLLQLVCVCVCYRGPDSLGVYSEAEEWSFLFFPRIFFLSSHLLTLVFSSSFLLSPLLGCCYNNIKYCHRPLKVAALWRGPLTLFCGFYWMTFLRGGYRCPESTCSVCIRSMKPAFGDWIQEVASSSELWAHSKSPLTPGSVVTLESRLLTIRSRKFPLALIWSCSFWPWAPGSVLSTSTGSMESLLAMTSGRKCPLGWMDGAILISFRDQAKHCVELAPSSPLMVNESAWYSLEPRLLS